MPGPDPFEALAVPGVRGLEPYRPGKPVEELEREYGVRDSVKLASNENPLGPPAGAIAAIRAAAAGIHRYPDGAAFALKAELAGRLGVAPQMLTIGNGSNDVIVMAVEAFLGPGEEAVCDAHAFVVFPLAVRAAGGVLRTAASRPADAAEQPLGHHAERLLEAVGPATRLVYIANPNNPTGTWLAGGELETLLESLPAHVIVILDEAYAEYAASPGEHDGVALLARFGNLVVTRTFSKIYALAGLRVGYAVSAPGVADLLNRIRQPFNANTLGQVAARAALDEPGFVERSRTVNAAGLTQLREGLEELGLRVPPSAANFVLVDLARPALPVYEALLRVGVITRPVANYGLANHLRISVGLADENARLLSALGGLRRQGRV